MVGKVALLLLVLLTTPLAAEAQQPRGAHRIGWLAPIAEDHSRGFREALRALGYVDGPTVVLELRFAEDDLDRLPRLASELVRAKVDVIVAVSPPAILAAKQATDTIPIVMAYWGADGLIDPQVA
jgi:putative tryptophan/tyrosine transport system substrate-binding protein